MNYIRIGLTGGPGCGKSETGRFFSKFPDWQCFDADRICHEIYSETDSPFIKLLRNRWGDSICTADGQPDRKAIAEKIFNSESERQWLDSILHPEIFFRLENRTAQSKAKFVLIEAALLFESKWNLKMDKTIAVWTPPEMQMRRLLDRGWTREHAEKRIRAQYPAEKKLELADYGIINQGNLETLEEQCRLIDSRIRDFYKNL